MSPKHMLAELSIEETKHGENSITLLSPNSIHRAELYLGNDGMWKVTIVEVNNSDDPIFYCKRRHHLDQRFTEKQARTLARDTIAEGWIL